ncbi:peptide ABC transporter substrate-binding protein SapA [Salinivibrio sp. ML323]|uniref:ABC transporter substrate-binding protein SapA n=1 Tax=Salinivibrio sp. ML323 TaxID=1909474 RepID=UPI0009848B93|nr:ABC transporter substrate-binding protein SapA [Salinivibrio sp. ML323]OOE58909.1 peptide ABC transporter substrate-binding protein SapA [Salinivibrio sp. ML323]
MRVFFQFLILGVSGLLLAGCDAASDQRAADNRGFVFCGPGQPNTFNPQLTDGGLTADTLSSQLYDRLLRLNPETYQPEAMLAKSWQVSDDGKTYTFSLRRGVAFHRSAQFTPSRYLNADDVVFSFRRLINPRHPFHHISGGQYPWFDSMNFAGLVTSVKALDTYRVQFTLSRPDVSFLSTLATNFSVILSKEYANQLLEAGTPEKLDTYPVGTGPFALAEYQPRELIRLRRHWQYWQGPAPMEQVVFDVSTRGTGTLAKMLTGECDVLASPVASQLPVVVGDERFSLSSQTGMNVAFIALNTRHPALSEVAVRQAINLAIDRGALLSSVYYGTGAPATSLLPPMSWAYDPNRKTQYDPKLAAALLAKAGYRHGFSVDLTVPLKPTAFNPSPRKTAELIQADLGEIGIDVDIIPEKTVNRTSIRQGDDSHDMVLTGWVADNGDPDTFLRPLLTCNAKFTGWNISNWCNRFFDQTLNQAIATDKIAKRKALYQEAQTILDRRMPVIPLAHGIQHQVRDASLTGLTMTPFGADSFADVSRER